MLGYYSQDDNYLISLNREIINIPEEQELFGVEKNVWIDFEVDTNNKIIINKKYNLEIGTPKENVSLAFYRYEKNNYPIGSFKNGFENMFCDKCKADYIGSFDSETCELCMLKNMIED